MLTNGIHINCVSGKAKTRTLSSAERHTTDQPPQEATGPSDWMLLRSHASWIEGATKRMHGLVVAALLVAPDALSVGDFDEDDRPEHWEQALTSLLDVMEANFAPLLEKCKELEAAIDRVDPTPIFTGSASTAS